MKTNKKYFHIGFHFLNRIVDKELEQIFNKYADDWLKYSENCWVIYTKYSADDLLTVVRPYLTKRDNLLILEITQNQKLSGWLPRWIWDWLHKKR